ncbi:MAG: DUF86 domain-containing protein [Ardenticatenales bacterium]|nr:DUF86 domain-containing protein [Ardenticatenales bacterium]
MLERILRIESYTWEGESSFLQNPLIQDAVIRNLEVIGEAAKRVPDEFRVQHPDIPWRALTGFRDVLIHQYEGVGLALVWSAVATSLPELRQAIEAVLPPLDTLEREIGGEDE